MSMSKAKKLSKTMSLVESDNGYCYATEIKAFAKDIGVVSPHIAPRRT
jgi:hypothetical protein